MHNHHEDRRSHPHFAQNVARLETGTHQKLPPVSFIIAASSSDPLKKTDNDSVFYGTLLILNVVGRFSIFEVTPDKSKFRKLRCSHLVDVATGGLRRLHFASVLNFIGPSSFAFRIRMILEEELQFRKKIVKLAPRGPATTSLKGVLEKRGSPIQPGEPTPATSAIFK